MDGAERYKLTIDAWKPSTIPMERLAAYMADFARLLGETTGVHFLKVQEGSAELVAVVDPTSAPKVEERMLRVRAGDPPEDAKRAQAAIERQMRDDNAIGTLRGPENVIYVDFVGRDAAKPLAFGPFRERHSLDGVVVKIGGIDSTIPVWLKDGDAPPLICDTDVETSKRLAGHYRGAPIRVHGVGTWMRGGDGAWRMNRFHIDDFEQLNDVPIRAVVRDLQSAGGSTWHESDDPIAEADRLRRSG